MVFTQIDSKANGKLMPMRRVSVPMRGVQTSDLYIFNAWVNGKRIYANNNEGMTIKTMEEAAKTDLGKGQLMIYAEPYNTLILDRKGFKCSLPVVKGLVFKNNIQAWVDRKVFVHNLGHATVAYYGYFNYPGIKYKYEVLKDEDVYSFAYNVRHQAAEVLHVIYPYDYSLQDMEEHINDLLERFQNKALQDTIYRVGKDLYRKLSSDDRFVGIIRLAIQQGMAYNDILEAMVYGLFFRCADEYGKLFPSDKDFIDNFNRMGLDYILKTVCMFDPNIDLQLIKKINTLYVDLRIKFLKNINKINSDEY